MIPRPDDPSAFWFTVLLIVLIFLVADLWEAIAERRRK